MTATIDRTATAVGEGLERRVAAIVQLAIEVADANRADCKAGLSVTLTKADQTLIAGLLPHTALADTRAALIECVDWVFRAREDSDGELSDAEVEAFLESARAEARDAILADTIAAGAA